MSYELRPLGPDRYLVWDLLRESDPYYLNHHFIEVDLTAIAHDRERRRAEGGPVPTWLAYALAAYGKALVRFPQFNSYLRMWPRTRLAVYDQVDIALTIEREIDGHPIILLAILRNAERQSPADIHAFLQHRRTAPLVDLEEFATYQRLRRLPTFCRWHLFQIFCKPFPGVMRSIVGTTAFTSVGKFGTSITAPISPRSATLSFGKVGVRPLVVNGEVKPATSVWLTLTYDHRIADGHLAAALGASIRETLESCSFP